MDGSGQTVDLAGMKLGIYDLEDVMSRAWNDHGISEHVAILSPATRRAINEAFKPYRATEKRDPSEELAYIRELVMRWGSTEFYEDALMPHGQILFIDKDFFPDWLKMRKTSTVIKNIAA